MIEISQLKDFSYYAPNLLKVKTEKRQIAPLQLNVVQQKLHRVWEWQLRTEGMVRINVLKARREGISTYVEGRLFHQTTTIPNTGSYIVTHDKLSLSKIFNMSKLFYDKLPSDFRPMKRYSNKTELVFENPNEKARLINPGLLSSIEVFSANTITATRSGGYAFGHNSEVAFWDNAEALITSAVPAIMDLAGTVIVNETTGNGRSGYFYEQWQKSKKSLKASRKLSKFFPVFFSWLIFPDYQTPFRNENEKKIFIATMDEEEKYILQKFKASFDQLNWRRGKILDFNGDVEKFHQEYPCDDEEAFIAKGVPYFAKKKLLEFRNRCVEPIERGDIGSEGFIPNEDGQLMIWERPIRDFDYVIGADVAEGIEGEDYSTMEVLKVSKTGPVVEQVAEWKGWIDAVQFALKLVEVAKWYNEALISPETGPSIGYTTLNEIKQSYWNIYRWQYFDRFKHYETERLGWQTNQATKPLLCSYTAACITLDVLIIRSQPLIDEMLNFVRNTTNSAEADWNCHDDLVMAYMIGLYTLAHTYQSGSLLQQLGKFKDAPLTTDSDSRDINKVIEQMKKNDPTKRDMELARGEVFEDEMMVGSDDKSWLNY